MSQSPKSGQLHSNSKKNVMIKRLKESQSPKSGQLHSNIMRVWETKELTKSQSPKSGQLHSNNSVVVSDEYIQDVSIP